VKHLSEKLGIHHSKDNRNTSSTGS